MDKQNTQHTQTPFSLPLEVADTREGPSIRDAQGERIAEAYTERGAAFIVRAVNGFDALITHLKEITDADVAAYIQRQGAAIQAAFPELKEAAVSVKSINSEFAVTGYNHAERYMTAFGSTIAEASAQMRKSLGTPETRAKELRAKAAALLAEAETLDAK